MKTALVDVPVQINIWVRKECQKQQFEIIRQARPSIIFLQSDGGRNQEEWDAILENRKLYDEGIDWDCKVYKLYEEKNNGLYAMAYKTMDLVWSKVDRCIFLEDDIIPSISFFEFCAEVLEKYKDDYRIHYVTGLNYKGVYEEPEADYFFCGEGCIWGFATWKRTFESQNLNYSNNKYAKKCISDTARVYKKGYEKLILGYANNENYGGHIAGSEFYKNYLRFAQNQLCIVPKVNLISNIGIGEGSAHSSDMLKKLPAKVQKLFYMETYEIEKPIKHPEFVVRDISYDLYVQKVLAWGHPFSSFARKVERLIRCVVYGDYKKIISGFKQQFIKQKET